MNKCFEDQFMDLQLALLMDCIDFMKTNGKQAQKLFLWLVANGTQTTFSLFSQNNHMITTELCRLSRTPDILLKGIDYVDEIRTLCRKHNRPCPVEARITFDLEEEKLDTAYFYEKNRFQYTEYGPNELLEEWIEEEKKKLQA